MIDTKFSTSIEGFNRVFAQLANQPSMVCWIRSLDYQRQLYLSPQFETIFGGTCESIHNAPKSWWEYLLPNDVENVKPTIDSRIITPEKNDGNSTILFRINGISNSIKYIRDTSFVIYNQFNKAIAIAGVGEELQPELWHKIISQKTRNEIGATYPDRKNVIDILNNENNNICRNKSTKVISSPSSFVINGIKITLTRRECEVLEHLKLGKTAKETGRDIFLSPRTVETHLENLKQKMCCKTKLELMSKCSSLPLEASSHI